MFPNSLLESEPASHIFPSLLCNGQAFIVQFAIELKRVERFAFFDQLDNSWIIVWRLRYKCDSEILVYKHDLSSELFRRLRSCCKS